MFKKIILLCAIGFSTLNAAEKIYIDQDEFKHGEDAFYIHLGNNVWVHTDCVHRDATGLFTYECSMAKTLMPGMQCAYQKTWKCPYCYSYWPIGTPCQNADCPSKYKTKSK